MCSTLDQILTTLARRIFGYGEIPGPLHVWTKRLLRYGAWRALQNHLAHAMAIGLVGVSGTR